MIYNSICLVFTVLFCTVFSASPISLAMFNSTNPGLMWNLFRGGLTVGLKAGARKGYLTADTSPQFAVFILMIMLTGFLIFIRVDIYTLRDKLSKVLQSSRVQPSLQGNFQLYARYGIEYHGDPILTTPLPKTFWATESQNPRTVAGSKEDYRYMEKKFIQILRKFLEQYKRTIARGLQPGSQVDVAEINSNAVKQLTKIVAHFIYQLTGQKYDVNSGTWTKTLPLEYYQEELLKKDSLAGPISGRTGLACMLKPDAERPSNAEGEYKQPAQENIGKGEQIVPGDNPLLGYPKDAKSEKQKDIPRTVRRLIKAFNKTAELVKGKPILQLTDAEDSTTCGIKLNVPEPTQQVQIATREDVARFKKQLLDPKISSKDIHFNKKIPTYMYATYAQAQRSAEKILREKDQKWIEGRTNGAPLLNGFLDLTASHGGAYPTRVYLTPGKDGTVMYLERPSTDQIRSGVTVSLVRNPFTGQITIAPTTTFELRWDNVPHNLTVILKKLEESLFDGSLIKSACKITILYIGLRVLTNLIKDGIHQMDKIKNLTKKSNSSVFTTLFTIVAKKSFPFQSNPFIIFLIISPIYYCDFFDFVKIYSQILHFRFDPGDVYYPILTMIILIPLFLTGILAITTLGVQVLTSFYGAHAYGDLLDYFYIFQGLVKKSKKGHDQLLSILYEAICRQAKRHPHLQIDLTKYDPRIVHIAAKLLNIDSNTKEGMHKLAHVHISTLKESIERYASKNNISLASSPKNQGFAQGLFFGGNALTPTAFQAEKQKMQTHAKLQEEVKLSPDRSWMAPNKLDRFINAWLKDSKTKGDWVPPVHLADSTGVLGQYGRGPVDGQEDTRPRFGEGIFAKGLASKQLGRWFTPEEQKDLYYKLVISPTTYSFWVASGIWTFVVLFYCLRGYSTFRIIEAQFLRKHTKQQLLKLKEISIYTYYRYYFIVFFEIYCSSAMILIVRMFLTTVYIESLEYLSISEF